MPKKKQEPFKNLINHKVVCGIAASMAPVVPGFEQKHFVNRVMGDLQALELKARVAHVSAQLREQLDPDVPTALRQIVKSLGPSLDGTEAVTESIGVWPLCHFVEAYGLDHFKESMAALYQLTKRFSAEFAVRPFLESDPKRALRLLTTWATDENPHVRRLVSEGSRPRLPWGMQLKRFVDDPKPVLNLISRLRDDPEEYVRRSVANNLNDISKDHPDLVADLAARWSKGASKDRQRLIRHALRGLIKQGHPGALAVLGFSPPKVKVELKLATKRVKLGSALEFKILISSKAKSDQRLLIDYEVYHRKANGSLSPKVFKFTKRKLPAGETLELGRAHPMRVVTTRKYHSGKHALSVLINGQRFGRVEFDLRV